MNKKSTKKVKKKGKFGKDGPFPVRARAKSAKKNVGKDGPFPHRGS